MMHVGKQNPACIFLCANRISQFIFKLRICSCLVTFPIWALLVIKTGRIEEQNGLFWSSKWAKLKCKTIAFGKVKVKN